MSKLEELLKKHCPDGVEYKTLSEIGEFSNIGVDKKKVEGEKEILLLNFMDVMKNIYIDKSIPKMVVTASDYKIEKCTIEEGDIFITPSSETIDEIGFASVITETIPNACYSYHIMRFRLFEYNMTTSIFIRYCFDSSFLRKQIRKSAQGITRFGLTLNKWKSLKIPLPPIEVQEEIVRILDEFTEKTTKLQELLHRETVLRKKQYEYYRDKLLTFNNNIEFKSLSECILNINNIKWNISQDKKFKYIDLSSVSRENNQILECQVIDYETAPSRAQQIVIKDDVIFGTTRPMLKRMCIIPKTYDNQICSTGFCVLRANKQIVLPKWILYCISTKDFFIYVDKNQKGVSYPAILDKEVKKYKIPVPPLEEQERIVKILDQFDTLCNDITKGLPAEIEMRKKQYEYYRDKLLTFKEKKK
ncbi:restriction endonuclease subunit S [Brachyspira pilosicoli]|uniref:restriction endonuclease subunit S n=1 Tax=Brachyspira pilosicoli TaxID=52584 RepID=UPI0030066194